MRRSTVGLHERRQCPLCTILPARVTKPSTLRRGSRATALTAATSALNLYPTLVVPHSIAGHPALTFPAQVLRRHTSLCNPSTLGGYFE